MFLQDNQVGGITERYNIQTVKGIRFRLQNFNPNDKLIYIIDLLTQFLNDQTVNYTFTLFWTVQQHIPNVQQHMLNVQQHIPNVQQHMLNVQQHIPMVQQHIWST